jgi:hypothetical protein
LFTILIAEVLASRPIWLEVVPANPEMPEVGRVLNLTKNSTVYPLAEALFNGIFPKVTVLAVATVLSSVEKVENPVFDVRFKNAVVIELLVIAVLTTPLPTDI